ncbi:hypothetical protein LHJ74_07690 [Streptomyces sp. N2-109]|uniref:Uncharacterized protein n=1 Tax=Streptomyces gossypii TaxID=2883101 RepID=A0ABT2JPI7_9ACTN|nr:hypothetical protein [Streptomyces gossypii]MCT2589797.1 hypothetical protein [Streptomyces gossypii]
MSAILTPTGPELRLLVSLSAWSWPGTGPHGREIAHSPASALPGTANAPEARMRRLADSLGGLGRAGDVVPDAGRCLHSIGDHVFLHFPGASRRLRLPSRPDWTALVARTGTAVLLLGLEPLSQSADASQLDTYLDAASGADRLLFGLARSR